MQDWKLDIIIHVDRPAGAMVPRIGGKIQEVHRDMPSNDRRNTGARGRRERGLKDLLEKIPTNTQKTDTQTGGTSIQEATETPNLDAKHRQRRGHIGHTVSREVLGREELHGSTGQGAEPRLPMAKKVEEPTSGHAVFQQHAVMDGSGKGTRNGVHCIEEEEQRDIASTDSFIYNYQRNASKRDDPVNMPTTRGRNHYTTLHQSRPYISTDACRDRRVTAHTRSNHNEFPCSAKPRAGN